MDSNIVTLLEDPLVRVDMSKLSVGDLVRMVLQPTYGMALLEKYTLDNLDEVPIEFAPVIFEKFAEELKRTFEDVSIVKSMFAK